MLLLALAALVLAAPLAWLIRCGGGWRTAALILTRLLVAVAAFSTVATDVLVLAALVGAAVVYGRVLGAAAHTENGEIETPPELWVWLAAAAALAAAGRVSPREWFS